jgi:hypothetical protein
VARTADEGPIVSLTDDVAGVLELIDGALGDAVPVEAGLIPEEPDDGDDNSVASDAMRWTAEPAKEDGEAYCPPGSCDLCDASITVSESPDPTFDALIVVFGDGHTRQWQDGTWVEVEPEPETVETVDGLVLHVTPHGETTPPPVAQPRDLALAAGTFAARMAAAAQDFQDHLKQVTAAFSRSNSIVRHWLAAQLCPWAGSPFHAEGPDPEVRRGMDPWEPLVVGDRVEVVGVAGWPGRVTEVAGPFASVVFPNGDVHSFGKDQLTLIGEVPDG